jgi:hypothetical protein
VRGVRTVAGKILQLKASSRKRKKKIPGKFSSKLFLEEGEEGVGKRVQIKTENLHFPGRKFI